MIIGVDARMFGLQNAGIGRYVVNLLKGLLSDSKNSYVIFARKDNYEDIRKICERNKNFTIVIFDFRHYSIAEQLFFPLVLAKYNFDLVHFPHFNVPLFYFKKFVVTIHDLLWHEMKGQQVTTHSGVVYMIKYLGYRIIFRNAVYRSKKIFVPSFWVKNKLINEYQLKEEKVVVAYEGVDEKFDKKISALKEREILQKFHNPQNYLIYVGSAYPHKNLTIILKTLSVLKRKNDNLKLIICGSRNIFLEKVKSEAKELGVLDKIIFLGFVSDEELKILLNNSLAFVFPSLSEGFGLPGLEAMKCQTPVVASKNGVFEEIYKDSALYFDPNSDKELLECIEILRNKKNRQEFVNKGTSLVRKYSWLKMTEVISNYYFNE